MTNQPSQTQPVITIDAAIERTPSGRAWDAYTLICDHSTGSYLKRGRVFRCRNLARRWLDKQSARVPA